jgi:hypothetical protein
MYRHTSPLDIISFIDVKENEDQEALISTLSKGGALFLLRHSSILFTSSECLHSPGSVIIAITRISWPHFEHIRCSFGICQNYQGVCFANSKGPPHKPFG